MKIGCDIDGVVGDIGKTILPYLRQVKQDAKIQDITDYNLSNFGFEERHLKEMFKSLRETGGFLAMRPIQGSIWGTHELTNNGHKIYFITARDQYPEVIKETSDWLGRNNFFFEELIRAQENKYPVCKDLGIELFIEDNPEEIRRCANRGLNMICFDQPWNREVEENKKIKRVKSWFELVETFRE